MQSNRGGARAESGLFSVQAESPYRCTARAQGGRVQKTARPREDPMDRLGRSLVGAAAVSAVPHHSGSLPRLLLYLPRDGQASVRCVRAVGARFDSHGEMLS